MTSKTYAIHAKETLIKRVDQHAERLQRSRNFLFNQAIEMLLDVYDADCIKTQDNKYRNKEGTNDRPRRKLRLERE